MRSVEGYGFIPDSIPGAIITLLSDSFWLFKHFYNTVHNNMLRASLPDDAANTRSLIRERLLSFERRETNTAQGRVTEVCRLTCCIQWRTLELKIPHRQCKENKDDCRQVSTILRQTQIADWMHMPYVYLWV